MAQSYPPPQLGVDLKRRRGPIVLFVVLLVVLVAAIAGIVVIVLNKPFGTTAQSSEPKPAAAGTLQFRRVLDQVVHPCTEEPVGPNERCDENGFRYTLGKVELDGSHVIAVQAKADTQGVGWVVNLTLDAAGSKAFAALTAGLVKQQEPKNQLAIVVKDQVVSAPTVSAAITAGQVQITGNFTRDSAKKLAADITG